MPDKEALLEEYMAQIAKGDHDALAALYQHTNASIYGFALSILKNASDAEDALHDCFLDIYQAAGSYRPQGKPMAWIFYHRPEPLPAKAAGAGQNGGYSAGGLGAVSEKL